jgi:hypothetical protein
MVELAVVPPLCAATKLARSATATADFATILKVAELRIDEELNRCFVLFFPLGMEKEMTVEMFGCCLRTEELRIG